MTVQELVDNGFIVKVGEDLYRLTESGRALEPGALEVLAKVVGEKEGAE